MARKPRGQVVCTVVFLIAAVGFIAVCIWTPDSDLRTRLGQTGALCGVLAFVFGMAASFPGWS